MEILRLDPAVSAGAFKPMNAVNNGPVHKRHANDQYRDNLAAYRAANIPFARNHDASFCNDYGGQWISAPCFRILTLTWRILRPTILPAPTNILR